MKMNRATLAILIGALALVRPIHVFSGGDEGWTELFNGKTLDGWTRKGGDALYRVEKGTIVGRTVPNSPNSFLCTEKRFGNFILELDFRVDEGLNSGVQIRSNSDPDYREGIVHGYQVEIDPAQREMYDKTPPNYDKNGEPIPPGTQPRGWTGGIYDEKRRGWLCDLTRNPDARAAFLPGEWNHFRIEAIGDGIRTWINGVPAASLVDFMSPNGFIALQVHSIKDDRKMEVRWKNIRIKDMGMNEELPEVPGRFIGDWKTEGGKTMVRIYRQPGGQYIASLHREDEGKELFTEILEAEGGPLEEMDDEGKLTLTGNKWSGVIQGKSLMLESEGESLELRRTRTVPPTLNQSPPEGAVVLFDGSNLDGWTSHAPKQWLLADGPAKWKILPGGRLEVIPGSGSIISKKEFGDFQLHLEFRLLGEPTNGGVYLQSRYEINIKDSYGQTEGSPCAALGNISKPEPLPEIENMALPPMEWQTFDIEFRAPRFDTSGGKKTEPARITLVFNGKTLYDKQEVEEVKGAASRLGEAEKGPLYLQEHGAAYQFRNIWVVEKTL